MVGRRLPGEAADSPVLVRQLKQFEVNWVELADMKAQLEKLGVHNVEVLRISRGWIFCRKTALRMCRTGNPVYLQCSVGLSEKRGSEQPRGLRRK